jgi:hypothetical protein
VAGKPLDYSKRGLLALRQKVATTVFQDPDQQIFYTDIDSDLLPCAILAWRKMRLPGAPTMHSRWWMRKLFAISRFSA